MESVTMAYSENEIIRSLNLSIDKNLDNPDFSTSTHCLELGISRSNLYRVIKENFHTSPSLYIRRQKLLKARDLLENSNFKVSEISYKIGIDSPQNFSKYFTKEFGVSPSEYRKTTIHGLSLFPPIVEEERKANAWLKKYYRPFLFLSVLSALGLGIYYVSLTKASGLIKEERKIGAEKSIAVLPFKNLGDSSKLYLSEGVMEQIHNSLSGLSELKVVSTTSSNKYKNSTKSIHQIAGELKVDYILNGSILQIDNEIGLRVELIDVKEDRTVWSENFEGELQNIFEYMNSVSDEVAANLNQKLISNKSERSLKKPTQNLEAYNAYLQGQHLLQTRTSSKIKASILKFDLATDLEPTFSDAIVSRALAYYMMGEDNHIKRENAFKIAEKEVLTAIKFDGRNGRAYAILGNIYKAQNKWEEALTTYQIALKYSPNDAQINYWYSLTLRSLGQMEEAIEYSKKAISLDPLAVNIFGGHLVGLAYAGRFDLAERAIKDGNLIFNDALLYHNAKGAYYVSAKKYKEALKEFEICNKLDSDVIFFQAWKHYTLAKTHQFLPVQSFLNSLPIKNENYNYFAIVYAGLGDKHNCLKYLELAADNGDSPNYLKVSPIFRFLHKEPRFVAVLNKLGLQNPSLSVR